VVPVSQPYTPHTMKLAYTVTLPNGKLANFKTAKPTTHVVALQWRDKSERTIACFCKSLKAAQKEAAKFTEPNFTAEEIASVAILPVNVD
jgi:hypothetical protein